MKMDPEALKEVKDAYQKVAEANRELHHEWLYHVVFTWRWWLALLLTVGIWGLWFWLRKKESTDRLLYAGFFVIFLSSWLDFIGVVNGYWRYTVDVFHTIPAFIVFDFSLIPVSVMLYLQFFPRLSPWIKGVLFAGGASFIGEPLFQWLDIYEPEKWRAIYSFPIFLGIYLMAHVLVYRNAFQPLKREKNDRAGSISRHKRSLFEPLKQKF